MRFAGALLRARYALLCGLGLTGAASAVLCVNLGIGLTASAIAEIPALFAIFAAGLLVTLRSAGLSAAALLSPLAGLLLAVFICDWQFPAALDAHAIAFGWISGFAATAILASRIAARVAAGEAPKAAATATMAELSLPLLAALVFALAIQSLDVSGVAARVTLLASTGAALSAILGAPLAASLGRPGETFVARFNRAGERRRRRIAILDHATQSRWAASLCGIALVLSVLGVFGVSELPWPRASLIWLVLPAVGMLIALAAMRDWRYAVAALLALVPVALLSLWIAGHRAAPFAALGIGAMAGYLVACTAADFVRRGDDAATAFVRVLGRLGPAILCALLTAALAMAAFAPFAPMTALGDFATLILGALGALAFTPAFAVSVEGLFPRRATIEARYRLR
ncbi:MAG: hypothetical protein ACREHE_14345 [Rhizomicrobium sp.]